MGGSDGQRMTKKSQSLQDRLAGRAWELVWCVGRLLNLRVLFSGKF